MQFKQATDFATAGAFSEKVAGPSKPSPGQGLLLCRWIDDHGGKAANCRVSPQKETS